MIDATAVLVIALALAGAIQFLFWQRARRGQERLAGRLVTLEREQRLAKADAESAHQETAQIADASYDPILVVDSERRIRRLNQAARDLFGVGEGSLGTSFIAVTRSHELEGYLTAALHGEPRLDQQLTLDQFTFRARIVRHTGNDGAVIRVVVTLNNVTELIRLTRARRDMVANFSHDMRTPISSIRLLVEMLRQNLGKNPQGDQTKLAKIASATDSLQHMMQELLDLSTIESGRAIMRMVETTFGDILSRSLEMMEAQFEEKGLTVINEAAMDVRVLADPDQVRRVINNIFHNAVKFTPKKGEIVISTAQTTSHLAVCIKDSGPGIPPFERTRVFERFYQVDGTRSGAADSRGRGTGLGLAIGKHIIEAHGGRIWVEGGIPSGACLLFTLPLA